MGVYDIEEDISLFHASFPDCPLALIDNEILDQKQFKPKHARRPLNLIGNPLKVALPTKASRHTLFPLAASHIAITMKSPDIEWYASKKISNG